MPHFPLMSMGTPFLFHNLSSHMINIRWSNFLIKNQLAVLFQGNYLNYQFVAKECL